VLPVLQLRRALDASGEHPQRRRVGGVLVPEAQDAEAVDPGGDALGDEADLVRRP
jgi:hypothetical protein